MHAVTKDMCWDSRAMMLALVLWMCFMIRTDKEGKVNSMVEKMKYYIYSLLSEHSSFKSIQKLDVWRNFSFKLLLLVLISSCSLKLLAFFNFNAIFGSMVYYCGLVWRFVASLLAAVKRLLSTTKAVLIMMYNSNGLNIPHGWQQESQHFWILQP